jgi:hypothetical protein
MSAGRLNLALEAVKEEKSWVLALHGESPTDEPAIQPFKF